MLFFNFLCLLYLMVLSNSHTISKSIDTDDGIDEVSDRIVNLDYTRHHRIRRDRIHRKYRIREVPTRQSNVITGADINSKTAKIADRPYTDVITFNATTANPTYRSHKRKIGGFWRRFKAKTTNSNIVNVKKRQVARKYEEVKNADDKESLYSRPTNRKKNFYSYIFQQPAIVTANDDLQVTVDVPLKKKHNNVKFVFTPYVMYASKLTPSMLELMDKSVHKKTTESMNNAIAKMNTQINNLKKIYGIKKSHNPTQTTTFAYPRTAEIEELLTGIKMKAIQTVVENGPSMVNVISNTVTEATFGAEHLWNKVGTPFSLLSTLHVDNIFKKDGIGEYSGPHHLVTRSVTNEPLSISYIEDMLQKEIKSIYHKMKLKVAKETLKCKPHAASSTTTTTTPADTITTTTVTPATTTNANSTILPTTTSRKPTTKCKTQKSKCPSRAEVSQYPIKTSTKPPPHHNKLGGPEASLPIPRLERDNNPTAANNTIEAEATNTDDYGMLNLYEQMLQKVQEDNAMKLIATANLPSNIRKNERYRLSKRNPETLTDFELKKTVQTLYNDGELIPDYGYLKTVPTPTTNEVEYKGYEMKPSTSYEDLSKKIAYDDFVNGYKHYLKFQQEKAKADNFSAMVKYQAHRHHNVDDIGKYILDKIPQLPQEPAEGDTKRLKRFFEDMDMEDQEVSTKTDDSWFKKHFYIFLDYGPPKKFHTSQIVSLKPTIADVSSDSVQSTKTVTYNKKSNLSNLLYRFESDDSTSDLTKETTAPINLDELTKSLDAVKSTNLRDSLHSEFGKVSKDVESTTMDMMHFKTLKITLMDKRSRNEERRELKEYIETKTKPMNSTVTYAADRHKRANESIAVAEDFVTKDLEEKSSTPAKEMQADVTLQSKNKSGNKFGYVDVNLVPTNSIHLHVNNTKAVKKSKLRDFFKKFNFKSIKSKKKDKRACTYRPPRFNPFKSLKNIIFKPSEKTQFTKSSNHKNVRTSTNLPIKPNDPLYDPILERPIEKQKTTKLNKFMVDTNDVQVPVISERGNFSLSGDLKTLPPLDTAASQQGKLPSPDLPSQAGKVPPLDTLPCQSGKLPSLNTFPSQPGKYPTLDSLSVHTGKPSTFLLMMNDGLKSVLYVQPETIHKSTRNINPTKRKTTTVKTVSMKMKQKKITQDPRGVLSVNVKTLRTLPSIVIKALTSSATNETLPDLNLEIAKMQYKLRTTERNAKAQDSRRSTFFAKSITRNPLVKPIIDGLTYTNQLTRIAKLSLPKSKRMEVRQNIQLSGGVSKHHDYHMPEEEIEEPMEKQGFEDRSSSSQIRTEKNFKNVDYFNDLLMWNNDILNIDTVPQPRWRDLVKSVEKDLGTTEYTTPDLFTMMNELKELDKTLSKSNMQMFPVAQSTYDRNINDQNFNDGLIRHVVLNDKALVNSKDLLIKGEQKYFQYNRPNIMNTFRGLPPTTHLPMWHKKNPFKPTINAWTADANFTVSNPIHWVEDKQMEPTPNCKPTVLSADKHITWTSGKKCPDEVTWKLESPIKWSSKGCDPKPPDDYLSKIARKFYFGSKPCRKLRLSSLTDHGSSQNNVKTAKVVKSGKGDLTKISTNAGKSETALEAGNLEASARNDTLTDARKDYNTKDTPALMVDTTLLSYDDEVETVTNGIDVKKMSRNSQKTAKLCKAKPKAMTRKSLVNVVAKTNERPHMYYSTPLPMKPSDFNKFLKEQGMDVESLISPIYGQTTLLHAWSSPPKPVTMSFVKNPQTPMVPSNSSAVTKLTSFISKYSTRIDKFRHKSKVQDKTKDNKNENFTLKKKSKNQKQMKKKQRIGAHSSPGSNRYKRVYDYVIDRPYLEQDLNPHKRIKKLKLFRQKHYELETSPTPNMESRTEETFPPELQAKLNHLQETKRITVPKTKPKSGPQINPKFLSAFEPQNLPTSSKKFDTEKEYTLKTKQATTAITTLVSTVEPEQYDSAPDDLSKLSGSIIFTSEDPHNKDVDITIINFDDIKKYGGDISVPIESLPQKDESLDGDSSVNHGATTTKSKAKASKTTDLSSKSVKLNEKYATIDSSYRLTSKVKEHVDNMAQGRLLLNEKLKQTAQVGPYTTYADMQFGSTEPAGDKHQKVFNCFDKLRRHHDMLNPKRIQISSHHYKYDIYYKSPENSKSKFPSKNKHQNQKHSSVQVVSLTTRNSSSLRMKNKYTKAITLREDCAQKKLKQDDDRRWVTIDSRFRYVRNVDVTDPDQESDKENEWNYYMEKDDADMKNLEKRFFGLSPKLHFIQDKLSLKRMTASPKSTPPKSKGTKATFKETTKTTKKMMTTSVMTPAFYDLYNPRSENVSKILEGDKLTDSLEGFRIQFGHKKISDAIEKIKAMSTDEPLDTNTYEMKYGIPGKFGFVRKNSSKNYEEFDILHGPSSTDSHEKDPGDKDVTFKIATGANPQHSNSTPAELEYEDMIQDPEHAAKTASEKAASTKFEQSIFDKSMYGKKTFEESVFEKAIFGPTKSETAKTKSTKTYSHYLTDIMSYDITSDNEKQKDVYDESSPLPDHVNVDNPVTVDSTTSNSNVTKKKNYIFDTASIIYNKSYLMPATKMVLYSSGDKTDKTTEKPWLPVAGNTLSVLFRNPLEGHLGFGVKPIIQVNQPKPAKGVTFQVTPVPTPMEILQARLSQNSGPPWQQMPIFQGNANWPQIQAASLGLPPLRNDFRYNSSEAYGIYMEPGVLDYDYNQPIASFGRDQFYTNLNYSRSEKKNAKHYFTTYFKAKTNTPKILGKSYFSLKHMHTPRNSNATRKNPFTLYIKTYTKNIKPSSKSTSMHKHHSVTIETISTTRHPQTKQHYVKRDIPGQDTYTAKDVAALEVIVDLMKNTLGYEEKEIGSIFTTNVNHPMKSIHQPHDSTNSIQVHIAIPYDMQNTRKRSPLEPVRVRKVFSAKMFTPVDLEYQVHSFEGGSFETPTSTASNDDGLSPGMYLLIDKPKNGYALKPVKTNIDFAELKSRQAGNVPAMELKGETTLRHDDSIKNLAKVTLSKNFISAVNRQLVEMYENLTKTNESHLRKRRHTTQTNKMMSLQVTKTIEGTNKNYRYRRIIDWDAVKKYFGYERVCNCKCKANKPMCRACAASDAVIEELTFEFDNLGKYMKDHCTEIQTYFWVNPSGGLKLRNAVDRIDESLRDYYKRSKGKCQGRTCEALGKQIEKRQFVKSTKVPRQSLVKNLLEDLICIADDVNKITAMKTCYNDKLQTEGKKMIQNINSCISHKKFGKRSDAQAAKKKFVKNVYSLDNINVNIICNPEISSNIESFESSTMHSMTTLASQKLQDQTLIADNFFEFDVDSLKNNSKRKGFKHLFLKRNNKKDKLFTYYTIEDTKTPKITFKREANNQIEMPLVADSGGTFWLEYLRAATTSEPQITKDPMTQKEPKLNIAVVQSNDILSNNNENSVTFKTMSVVHDSVSAYPIMGMNRETTTDNVPDNLNQLLNLFENFLEAKKNINQNFSVFSQNIESKQTAKIKSVKPKKIFVITPYNTNRTAVTSLDKLKKNTVTHSTRRLHTTSPDKTTSPKTKTSSIKFWGKNSNITPKDKKTSNITRPANRSTDTLPKAVVSSDKARLLNMSSNEVLQTNVSSYTIPEGSLSSKPISGDTIFTDTISSDFNVSETKSTESLFTENLPTDAILSQTKSSNDIFSDTLSLDTDNTDNMSVDSSNKTTLEDISSDIVPPDTIYQDNVSQDDKPNVSDDKLLESISLPNASSDILSNSPKDAMAKVTMSVLYSLNDIEKQLYAIQSKFLLDSESTPSVQTKFKSKQFRTVEEKHSQAPTRFLNEYYLITTGSKQTTSNTETTDLLRTHPITVPNEINQKLTNAPERTTAKTLETIASITTEKTTQKTYSAKQEFLERVSSPTNFLDMTSHFYLLKKTSPVLGPSNFKKDRTSTTSMDSTASSVELNSQSTYGHPKIIIINEYDQIAENALNQNDRNSDKYRNLLLSIIQYETNRLNDEWQKIAYANDKNYGYKRSATLPGSSWQSTFRSNLEDSVSETAEPPKKKGLLNKLVSKIGMKVVSAKKKVAHSSSSNCSVSRTLTGTMINFRRTDKPTAAFKKHEDVMARIKSKNNTVRHSKQNKAVKTTEASHLYPSSRTVCDIQATFNHVTERRQELAERNFEAYVKDFPCYKYKRLQRSFLITRKTRIPKWDWIRNKRSLLRFDKYENSDTSNQYCDKFEMFVKDDDGIYRIVDRKKRDTSRSIYKQLRHLPLLKPGKNELYVMVGDSVTLDCPLQPQRSTYSQYIWGADPKELLNCDNVRVDGLTLVIKKVGPRNAGRYSCSVETLAGNNGKLDCSANISELIVHQSTPYKEKPYHQVHQHPALSLIKNLSSLQDGVVRRSTKVRVVALPMVDVVFLPTYKTPRDCNYDDLKAIQQLGREMSNAVGCGNICSIRIDEPMCQKDRATNRSLIRSTGVLTMSPRRFQCSVQCRRDLFSSLLRLTIANIPAVTNTRVVISKDGVNETLKPWKYVGRPVTTHTLRKKDSSGHFEYHRFSSVAESGQMNIVTLCHPGFYLLTDQKICAPCPANTSSSLGANVCAACGPGMAAPPGAAECHSVVNRLRRYDWWWYPPCGYVLAFGGLVCACGVCMALALVVHLGSRGMEARCRCDRITSACLERTSAAKPHIVTGYMHSSRARPLSPSRVILARFYKPSLPSSRGTVVDSQETRFELWKERNIPPSLPDIDFDVDTS